MDKAAGGLNPSYYQALATALEPLTVPYQKPTSLSLTGEQERVVELLDCLARALEVDHQPFQNQIVNVLLKVSPVRSACCNQANA